MDAIKTGESEQGFITTLTIMRYAWWGIPFGFLSMAIFRLSLLFQKNTRFWRLMGSGKNGTFDKTPDLKQWAMLCVHQDAEALQNLTNNIPNNQRALKLACGSFIAGWISSFCLSSHTYLLQPIEGHGLWNGKKVFGHLPKNTPYEGKIAVMTRATIRLGKLGRFWSHVDAAASQMATADGFVRSYGIGEIPWIKQATFSIWDSKAQMKQFAYGMREHQEIIRKTHQEDWYSEEMFVRFKILAVF